MQNVHFTPPTISRLFGVNVSTIKRWVNKGYLPAEVTAGGHRRISRDQLEKFIKKHPKFAKDSYVLRRFKKKSYCPPQDCWKKYYDLLKKNETEKAAQLIEKTYLSGASILEILKKAITPAMRYIAHQWSTGKITTYEEHRMSFYIRVHIIRLDQLIPDKTDKKSPLALLACAPSEYHELPLQLVSLIYKLNGWRTHILGVNIKIGDLLKVAKKVKPQIITISKTYTKKESESYMNKLSNFADKNNICLALGGGAWQKKFNQKKRWTTKKCSRYFPALSLFSSYLGDYKRKK